MPRQAFWTRCLMHAVLASALLGSVEWSIYLDFLQLDRLPLQFHRDAAALWGFCYLKNFHWILVLAALSSALPRFRTPVYLLSTTILFLATSADMICVQMNQAHLLHYIQVLFVTAAAEALAFVGGPKVLVAPISSAVALGLLAGATWRLTRSALPRRGQAAVAGLYLLGWLLQWTWSDGDLFATAREDVYLAQRVMPPYLPRRLGPVQLVSLQVAALRQGALELRAPAQVSFEGSVAYSGVRLRDWSGTLPAGQVVSIPLSGVRLDGPAWVELRARDGSVVQKQYVRSLGVGSQASFLPAREFRARNEVLTRVLASETAALNEQLAHPPPNPTPLGAIQPKQIVFIVLESWARASLMEGRNPRLYKLFQSGVFLKRHYSDGNGSHLGIYSLLYGRSPLYYRRDLAAETISPQLARLRQAGYRTAFYTSGRLRGWRWMHRLVEGRFDFVGVVQEGATEAAAWPERDRLILSNLVKQDREKRPQFLFSFLNCTHFPYIYPPDFDKRKPGLEGDSFLNPSVRANRYANAIDYMEDQILKTIDGFDMANTIVVITGDHGESFGEDGSFGHGNKPSEVQFGVPCCVVGGGLKARVIEDITVHSDLLPSILAYLQPEVQATGELPIPSYKERVLVPETNLPPYRLLMLLPENLRLLLTLTPRPPLVDHVDLGPGPAGVYLAVQGLLDERGETSERILSSAQVDELARRCRDGLKQLLRQ